MQQPPDNSFGIYILTYPGDYSLSAALVNSLRHFCPGVPIMLIPGNGFEQKPFPIPDVPVLDCPAGFDHKPEGGHDRKFWCFGGPFERFLYLDADILCLLSLDSFVTRLRAEQEPFLFAYIPDSEEDLWTRFQNLKSASHDAKRSFFRLKFGNIDNIARFDPGYPLLSEWPFNGGVFASSKKSFNIEWFNEHRRREVRFFEDTLGMPYSDRDHHSLFFGDQGKLRYITWKHGVRLLNLYPDGHYYWGGRTLALTPDEMLAGQSPGPFIHWSGAPKPSHSFFSVAPLFRFLIVMYEVKYTYRDQKRVPAYDCWRYFSSSVSTADRLRATIPGLRSVLVPALVRLLAWRTQAPRRAIKRLLGR